MPFTLRLRPAIRRLACSLAAALGACAFLAPFPGLAADLDGPALQAHVAGQSALLARRHGRAMPSLSASDWAKVAAGKPVKKRFTPGGQRLQVASITQVVRPSPAEIWLGIADVDHDEEFMPDIAEAVSLERNPDGSVLQYGYLDIKSIFVSDRHWVVRFRPNPALYAESGGKVWEWTYRFVPDAAQRIAAARAASKITRLADKQLDSAVLIASSEGGWTLMKLPDGRTLVSYQIMSDIGGVVPDAVVASFAASTLDDLVAVVTRRAGSIYTHYDAAHPAIPGPDGAPLPKR